MKIAILTIAMGDCSKKHLPAFLTSVASFMFKGHEVTTIVFGDSDVAQPDGCVVKQITPLPYPLPNVLKFQFINSVDLSKYDLIYCMDPDCEVVKNVGKECFPDKMEQIVVVRHPWVVGDRIRYAHEHNPKSTAFIDDDKKIPYFQSCFFGAYAEAFLKMSRQLQKDVDEDLKNKIIANCYDESYLNKYIRNRHTKKLNIGHAFPDPKKWKLDWNPDAMYVDVKIIHYNEL